MQESSDRPIMCHADLAASRTKESSVQTSAIKFTDYCLLGCDPMQSLSYIPIQVAARSKARVFSRSPAEIVGFNPTRGMDASLFVCCECCVLSSKGLCDGLITRPEGFYRLWCVIKTMRRASQNKQVQPLGDT